MNTLNRRPKGVFVISVLLLAGTVIATVTGISLLWPGTFLDGLWALNRTAYLEFTSLGRLSGPLLLLLGVVTAIAGLSLFRGRKWGWTLTVALFAVNATGDAIRLFIGDRLKNAAGLLIVGCFLFYLTRRAVRAWFGPRPTA